MGPVVGHVIVQEANRNFWRGETRMGKASTSLGVQEATAFPGSRSTSQAGLGQSRWGPEMTRARPFHLQGPRPTLSTPLVLKAPAFIPPVASVRGWIFPTSSSTQEVPRQGLHLRGARRCLAEWTVKSCYFSRAPAEPGLPSTSPLHAHHTPKSVRWLTCCWRRN